MKSVWPWALAVVALAISPVSAQTPPPPAGIEERLGRLEEGQRSLEKRLDDVRTDMNERFADVNRRLDDLRTDMNERFGDINRRMDQRFDDLNRRISDLVTFLQILVGVLAVMAVGIFGTLLLMWRRLVKVEADVALLSSQFRLVRTP